MSWDQLVGLALRDPRVLLDSEVNLVRVEKGVQRDCKGRLALKVAKVYKALKVQRDTEDKRGTLELEASQDNRELQDLLAHPVPRQTLVLLAVIFRDGTINDALTMLALRKHSFIEAP